MPDEPMDRPVTDARTEEERLHRWRLILGKPAEESLGVGLSGDAAGMDGVL